MMSIFRRALFVILALLLPVQLLPTPLAHANQGQVMVSGIESQLKPPYEQRISWSTFAEQEDHDPDQVSHYAYGNGIYATGYSTSTDGIHWTDLVIDDKDRDFTSIVFGNGVFLGVGHGNNHGVPVWTSKDGVHWSEKTIIPMGAHFRDVIFTGKRFVVISDDSNDYNVYDGALATSEDGMTWKVHPNQLEKDAKVLASGNGILLALTSKSIYKSKDGIVWKKVSVPVKGTFGDIRFADGKFVAVANGAVLSTTDGTKWIVASTPNISWFNIVWVKDRFFVSSFNIETKPMAYMTSKDGKTWAKLKVPGAGLQISEIIFEDSQYISKSYWGHFTSKDGVNWKQTKNLVHMPVQLQRSAVGDGKLVSVGGSESSWGFFRMNSSGTTTYRREDGKIPLNDVIWTGKQFFAVGSQGLMMTSKDGISWTKVASPTTEEMYRIILAKDTYYVTGSNGLIMSSRDLKTWKKQRTNTTFAVTSIAWSGKKFVAVGENMRLSVTLTSDNGTDWKPVNIRIAPDGNPSLKFTDIAWGNGTFVISAKQNFHLDLPYTVFISSDGTKWKKVDMKYETTEERNMSPSLYGVQFTGDQFVAVGNNGSVYLSKDGNEWGREEIPSDEQLFSAQFFNGKLYVVGLTNQVYIGEFK